MKRNIFGGSAKIQSPINLKTYALKAVAFLSVLLSSCGNSGGFSEMLTQDCFPTPLISTDGFEPRVPAEMDVYLDTSVSSTNFGLGGLETPYRDLIAYMLEQEKGNSDRRLFGFANKISSVNRQVFLNAAKGNSRVCAACGFSETRLDELLSQISGDENSALSIIVTDLWLDNNDLIDSRLLSLYAPVKSLMAQGKSIGILGVKAPYRSAVYDIPGSSGSKVLPAGEISQRPFFMLIIGDIYEVSGVYSEIEGVLFKDAADSDYAFNIFSPQTPATLDGFADFKLEAPDNLVRSGGLEFEADRIPDFILSTKVAARLFDDAIIDGKTPAFAGLIARLHDKDSPAHIPQPGSYNYDISAYTLEGKWREACSPDPDRADWVSAKPDGIIELRDHNGTSQIALNLSGEAAAQLPAETTYWINININAQAAPDYAKDAAWMASWGFKPAQGEMLYASPPEFFPTLNLEALRALLDRSAREVFDPSQTVANANIILVTE